MKHPDMIKSLGISKMQYMELMEVRHFLSYYSLLVILVAVHVQPQSDHS